MDSKTAAIPLSSANRPRPPYCPLGITNPRRPPSVASSSPAPRQTAKAGAAAAAVATVVRAPMKPTSFAKHTSSKSYSRAGTSQGVAVAEPVLGGSGASGTSGASSSPVRVLSDILGTTTGFPIGSPVIHASASTLAATRPQITALKMESSSGKQVLANPVTPFAHVNEKKRPAEDIPMRDRPAKRPESAGHRGGKAVTLQAAQKAQSVAGKNALVQKGAGEGAGAGAPAKAISTSAVPLPAIVRAILGGQSSSAPVTPNSASAAIKTGSPDYTPILPLTNAGDRPYNVWRGSNGQLEETHGALLPTGYRLSDNARYPFVCPIRSCAANFRCETLLQLGHHFSKSYKGVELNDNRDGTFTIVRHKPPGLAHLDPIVCSRTSLMSKSANASLVNRPTRRQSMGLATPTPSVEVAHRTEKPSPTQAQLRPRSPYSAPKAAPRTAWEYFASVNAIKVCPPDHDFLAVADLPARRALPESWLELFSHKKELNSGTIFTALVYVCGDEAATPCDCCQNSRFSGCSPRSFLAPPCVVTPAQVRHKLHSPERAHACMGCIMIRLHHRKKNTCSFIVGGAGVGGKASTPVSASTPKPAVNWNSATASSSGLLTPGLLDAPAGEKSADDVSVWETPSAAEPPAVSATPTTAGATRSLRKSVADARSAHESHSKHLKSRDSHVRALLVPPDQQEDWEVAPGLACVDWGYGPKAVAFSCTYLSSTEPINIDPSYQANWLTLAPGKKHAWSARDDRTRICTVIQGRLGVTFYPSTPAAGPDSSGTDADCGVGVSVVVNPRGVFKIPINLACKAVNIGGVDGPGGSSGPAEIYVTTAVEPGALIWEKDSACDATAAQDDYF